MALATGRGKGVLDLLMVLAGGALVVLGVVMVASDYAHEVDSMNALRAFGSTKTFDPSYRLTFVPWLLALSAFVTAGLVARWFLLRRSPKLARHAQRPMTLLAIGSSLVDLAYYADTTFGLQAPHAVRAIGIDPLYALGGLLVAGAAWRVRSLVRPLPPGDPDA